VLEHQAPDAREPRTTAADLGRIEAEVGWRPRVSLARGLAAQAERALALAP
jgi:nucleoside-diphosphate-sugar epimerase